LYNKCIVSKTETNYIYLLDLGKIQNKSPKNQFEYAQFRPYSKKKGKTPPQ